MQIPMFSALLCNWQMMTIDEIRRANLEKLLSDFGGGAALAVVIEKSEAQISQWKKASLDSKTGRPRGISDDICRHIEKKCDKVRGWMDNFHQGDQDNRRTSAQAQEVAKAFDALKPKQQEAVMAMIEGYDVQVRRCEPEPSLVIESKPQTSVIAEPVRGQKQSSGSS